MTVSLANHLNYHGVDSARLEHAMRFLIAQWADYKSPEDMTAEMIDAGLTPDALHAATTMLSQDPDLLDEAALGVLSAAWNAADLHEATRASLEEAATRLPVIEVGAIVVAAMYGLWLLTTRGKQSVTRIVRRHADGTYEEVETTEWYDPAGPLRAVVDLIRPPGGEELPAPTSPPSLPDAGQSWIDR